MPRRLLLAVTVATATFPGSISAQDVEMLGRRYGTQPPDAYFEELARNPDAFRFQRGRAGRMRGAAQFRLEQSVGGALGATPAAVGLGPREEAVVGDVYVPVILGRFADSPTTPPVTQGEVQTGYFGPQAGSVADFYGEISNDSITLHGDVLPWVTSTLTQAETTQGISALGCCGIGDFIKSLLDAQAPMNWGAYDNDGPDGVPNSGDDDGYVDALAVIHPTRGAECSSESDLIWAHKWTLSDASSGGPYLTTTPRTGYPGQVIRVEDYFVQGALRCSGAGLNEIGVFAHEMGHAFGLPDLYDTRSGLGPRHDGAGSWELMASGTWGCDGTASGADLTPESPCHMGAWAKAALGWVTVDTLPPDTDLGTLTLPPVETDGVVYRIDAQDGSDTYWLLENRQSLPAVGYDQGLPGEGLLIWQIAQSLVDARWANNVVNGFNTMGVWLRQADGLDELRLPGGDRGDAGDPFPGATNNVVFHALSDPASTSSSGTAAGVTVVDIGLVGDDVAFDVITGFPAHADLLGHRPGCERSLHGGWRPGAGCAQQLRDGCPVRSCGDRGRGGRQRRGR